jgi:RNA polymerase sigma factor (sigma-70 family)
MKSLSKQADERTALADFGPDEASRWDAVVRRFRAPLEGFFRRRVGNASDVEDLVQEVFVRLLKRASGEPIATLEHYLFRTAAHVYADRGRYDAMHMTAAHESYDASVHELPAHITPERVTLGRESLQCVVDALRELPERTRDIFVLRALELRKTPEVAAMLHLSTRSIELHMAKALTHLAQVLERGGDDAQ